MSIDDNYSNRFRNRLENYFTREQVDTLCDVLTETGAYIAGSFPLCVLIDANWNTDLDIWISTDPNSPEYRRLMVTLMRLGIQTPLIRKSGKTIDLDPEYSRFSREIHDIVSTKRGNLDIQIINTRSPLHEIVNGFDIRFCSLAYNGNEFLNDDEEKAIIFDDVTGREIFFNPGVNQTPYEWLRSIGRVVKYYARGFVNIDFLSLSSPLKRSILTFPRLNQGSYPSARYPQYISAWNASIFSIFTNNPLPNVPEFDNDRIRDVVSKLALKFFNLPEAHTLLTEESVSNIAIAAQEDVNFIVEAIIRYKNAQNDNDRWDIVSEFHSTLRTTLRFYNDRNEGNQNVEANQIQEPSQAFRPTDQIFDDVVSLYQNNGTMNDKRSAITNAVNEIVRRLNDRRLQYADANALIYDNNNSCGLRFGNNNELIFDTNMFYIVSNNRREFCVIRQSHDGHCLIESRHEVNIDENYSIENGYYNAILMSIVGLLNDNNTSRDMIIDFVSTALISFEKLPHPIKQDFIQVYNTIVTNKITGFMYDPQPDQEDPADKFPIILLPNAREQMLVMMKTREVVGQFTSIFPLIQELNYPGLYTPLAPIIDKDLPNNCFDYIMFSEVELDEWRETVPAPIFLITEGNNMKCSSIDLFTKFYNVTLDENNRIRGYNRNTDITYDCSELKDNSFAENPYAILRLEFPVVVPFRDVRNAIRLYFEEGINHFKLDRTTKTITKTMSMAYATHLGNFARRFNRGTVQDAMVSGDHCQDGTQKQLYRIIPIRTSASNSSSSSSGN